MSFFEFPHTRTYDSDLGWLIKEVKKISDEYQALIDWKNSHETEYSELLRRVNNLELEINTFEAQIQEEFDSLKNGLEAYIYEQIHEALGQLIIELGDVRAEIIQLRADVTRAILDLEGDIRAQDMMLRNWVNARLDQFIEEIPDLTTINVWNPVRGALTSVQIAIDDLYNLGRSGGLTASEYDAMQLTASEYDSLDLTAYEYDNYAKDILGQRGIFKNPLYYMNSPFTGEYVPIVTVINELAHLHKADALTASEYDALDLSAADYDTYDLTAYDYDWSGKLLLV